MEEEAGRTGRSEKALSRRCRFDERILPTSPSAACPNSYLHGDDEFAQPTDGNPRQRITAAGVEGRSVFALRSPRPISRTSNTQPVLARHADAGLRGGSGAGHGRTLRTNCPATVAPLLLRTRLVVRCLGRRDRLTEHRDTNYTRCSGPARERLPESGQGSPGSRRPQECVNTEFCQRQGLGRWRDMGPANCRARR